MATMTLKEAAALLKVHPQTLREMAKKDEAPAAKIGRRWVFVEEDLVSMIRSRYAENACGVSDKQFGGDVCHSRAGKTLSTGISMSQPQQGELDALLAPKTKRKPKSSKRN